MTPQEPIRRGRVKDVDRRFDIEYWQSRGSNAIFAAAWEMVVEAWRLKGRDESELEFQQTIKHFRHKDR